MNKIIILISLFFCITNCDKGSDKTPIPNPGVSISDVAMAEGNAGGTNFNFTVSLDRTTDRTVSLNYSTQDGTAISGSDYTGVTNQTLSFQPGETSKTITIIVTGDVVKEDDEKFTVVLSNVINATLTKSAGTATIQNDDDVGSFNNLVWADEFNGSSLNTNDWSFDIGDGCPSLCGWGNNELEYYTNRPENLFLQNGNLIIEAKKESFGGKNYTSAKIVTRGKKTFKFGRIEIRAKLPKGKGIWPAIWMLPQNNVYGGWPKSGEIDIMELVGHEPNKTHGTLHFGPGPGSTQISRSYTVTTGDFSTDFHIFSIVWERDVIKWYVDGQLFSTVTNVDVGSATYPFNEEFYFIINLAVGGNWPGSPDATTTFPQQLTIDYIRVYQ